MVTDRLPQNEHHDDDHGEADEIGGQKHRTRPPDGGDRGHHRLGGAGPPGQRPTLHTNQHTTK